jgi:hypothetical protein
MKCNVTHRDCHPVDVYFVFNRHEYCVLTFAERRSVWSYVQLGHRRGHYLATQKGCGFDNLLSCVSRKGRKIWNSELLGSLLLQDRNSLDQLDNIVADKMG